MNPFKAIANMFIDKQPDEVHGKITWSTRECSYGPPCTPTPQSPEVNLTGYAAEAVPHPKHFAGSIPKHHGRVGYIDLQKVMSKGQQQQIKTRSQRRLGTQEEWVHERSQEEIALAAMSNELIQLTGVEIDSGRINRRSIEFSFVSAHNADRESIERQTGKRCKVLSDNRLKIY